MVASICKNFNLIIYDILHMTLKNKCFHFKLTLYRLQHVILKEIQIYSTMSTLDSKGHC